VNRIGRQFFIYEKKNQNTVRYSDGQTGDVDNRVQFLSPDVAKSDFKVVVKHAHFGF
jgi:hypothetical protein